MTTLRTVLLAACLAFLAPGSALAAGQVAFHVGAMDCTAAGDHASVNQPLVTVAPHDTGTLTLNATGGNVGVLTPCVFLVVFDGYQVNGVSPQGTVTLAGITPCTATMNAACVASVVVEWDVPFASVECSEGLDCGPIYSAYVDVFFHLEVNGANLANGTARLLHGPPIL